MHRFSRLACLAALAGSLFAAELTSFPSSGTVPRPSPEYAVKMPQGKPELLLSKYRGKIVAVGFLLTTCPHCQKTAQILDKLYKEYGSQGFQPIGIAINVEDPNQLVPQFVSTLGLSFPVGCAPNRDSVSEYLQMSVMKSMMMPQLVLLDRKGVIRAQFPGDSPFFVEPQEQHMRELIGNLLKGGPEVKQTSSLRTSTGAKKAK